MAKVTFSQKFRTSTEKLINNDFPDSARTALVYLIQDLFNKQYIYDQDTVIHELNRIGRFTSSDFEGVVIDNKITAISFRLNKLSWQQVYEFCERIYSNLLNDVGNGFNEIFKSLDEVRIYYENEINQIAQEENLGYQYENGEFIRKGRAQTQKAIDKVGVVLSDPKLEKVRATYL